MAEQRIGSPWRIALAAGMTVCALAGGAPAGGDVAAVLVGAGIPVLLVILALAGAASAKRRRSACLTPLSVFVSARDADDDRLRELAAEQVSSLRELVDQPFVIRVRTDDDATGVRSQQARAEIARALEAGEAAGMVLDGAAGRGDLAGVLVLTHLGRNAVERARALSEHRRAWATYPLCFFNPLHGEGTREVGWRLPDSPRSRLVRVCPRCARGMNYGEEQRRPADALTEHSARGDYPYYEADARTSVWAATGYGQFGEDLVRLITTHGIGRGRWP